MQWLIDRLDRGLSAVLIALVVLMVFSITAEILLTAVVQPLASLGLQWLQERQAEPAGMQHTLAMVLGFVAKASAPVNTTSQTLLVWIGILGSALALRYRAHLGVDAVVRLYPPKVRLILDYISTALIALFSLLVLGVGGWQVAYRAFAMGSKMPGIEFMNRGWFYLVLLITGILNLIYCVYHFTHPKIVELQPTTEKEASES